MLNNNNSFKFDVNAVSGTIRKSHPKSIICVTSDNPYLLNMNNPRTKYDGGYDVVVLQVMILKDGFIIEYVRKEDFIKENENDRN